MTIAGVTSSWGSTAVQLFHPYGLVLDSSSAVYIADRDNSRIQKWPMGSSNGTTVAGQSGSSGAAAAYLNSPADVAIDSSSNVYVADTSNHRVQYWTTGASFGTTVAGTGRKKNFVQKLIFLLF
jgi:DNA-binding beta-propeller fold protein YncE